MNRCEHGGHTLITPTAGAGLTLPRHYIYCARNPPNDRFRVFYGRAKREGWGAHAIDSGHNPHITRPGVLADLLT